MFSAASLWRQPNSKTGIDTDSGAYSERMEASSSETRFILLFSQSHTDFRVAELEGIGRALGLQFDCSQVDAQVQVFA